MTDRLSRANELISTAPDEALKLCNDILNDDPESSEAQLALFLSGYLMMEAERYGIAFHIFKRCAEMTPKKGAIYTNMGMCLEESNPDEALRLFQKAFKLDQTNGTALANEGLMRLQKAQPEVCISLSNRALNLDPTLKNAVHNRGLAKLMLRDPSGWADYNASLGVKHREKRDYGKPEWSGEEGQRVIVYGEQGVGDEIMFASCLPDMSRSNRVIFDCDARLESIFRRSFPDIEVHGTRFKEQTEIDIRKASRQTAIGQLPYYFRKCDGDYPATAYLVADPERVTQWAALLDENRPKIGIAWRGGTKSTGEKKRSTSITDFENILKIDADFVSLDYHVLDKAEQDYLDYHGVKHWSRAVEKGCDLEETFALVANLDHVITVCTTIVYVAGSMGIPCSVLVPREAGYRYHLSGNTFPWYSCVKLYRGDFKPCLISILASIKEKMSLTMCCVKAS